MRVLVPTHPGFAGTERPEALASVSGLATLYGALLDQLDLTDVTVIGNSIGGWITLSTRSGSRCPAIRWPTSSP
ncbi:alpha/beta fold hydrolase [Streptomyces hokutonensis]|uniref:Alpha/beta fold hydrolase n=1 Tax=Streptomyces hokutonensis TaxID=1306990 RepID=A0ABW6M5E5_9ACTN